MQQTLEIEMCIFQLYHSAAIYAKMFKIEARIQQPEFMWRAGVIRACDCHASPHSNDKQ